MELGEDLALLSKQSQLAQVAKFKDVISTGRPQFISAIDFEMNMLILTVVQPKIGENQQTLGSQTSSLAINLGKLSDMDVINLHRHTGEIVAQISTVGNRKIQAIFEKVSNQPYVLHLDIKTKNIE